MPLAGAGYGAGKALEDIMAEQMVRAQMQAREQEAQARTQLESQRLNESIRQNDINNAQQNRVIDDAEATRRDQQAAAQTAQNRRSDMAGVLAMPGMSNEAKAQEIGGSAIRGGADPLKVIESLTKTPSRTPLHQVTVRGDKGQPITKGVTDEEFQRGVETYEKPPAPEKPQRTELTPGQAFTATRQLRNDYTRETTSAKTVAQQLSLMRSSLDAARKGDLAAGSQGVLVTFQKILDPNSVVRESEYARSAAGQSLMSQMEGAVTKLQAGGAGVPVDQLQKFADLAEKFAKNQSDFAKTSKQQIDAIAKEYGLKSENITRDFEEQPGGGDVAFVFNPNTGKLEPVKQ